MNTSVATLIDTLRNTSSQTTGQGIANIVEVVHQAYTNATTETTVDGQKRSEFNKWLIIVAAVVGGFFVLRGIRKAMKFALVMFWIWFWVGGHSQNFFNWW